MKKHLLLPLALAFASNAAMAANSVDLRVTGTIAPAACNISIVGGGVFDLETISASTLNETGTTALVPPTKSLSVTCSGLTAVAVKALDNNPNLSRNSGDFDGYGLGLDSSGNEIGHYAIKIFNPIVNGIAGQIIRSDDGTAWTASNNPVFYTDSSNMLSWGTGGQVTPVAVDSLTTTLEVQTYINLKNTLNTSNAITTDGSATIELVYL